MPTSDKTVKVTLVAVATPYAKGMNDAAGATRKLGAEIDTIGGKTKGLEANAGKAGGALKGMAIGAGAIAATGLVAFLGDSVKAAGDLQQSMGGVDAVFKDNAKAIHDFGEDSAEAVGLARNEFNQLITVTGAMLKNKGLEDFTQKSLDLVKVGADLAAQFGGSTADAVGALNAAMRGESDPIERYGISLNETAVNAELARKGLNGLEGAALDQAKAMARIEIIMRQSADATGAFAREADTLQGQQQRLTAEWTDAKAELGTALLPALTDVTRALRDGVDVAIAAGEAWGSIPGPVKAAVAALVLYHLTNQRVATGVTGVRDGIKRMREELALQQALAGGITGGYQRLGDEAKTAGTQVSRAAGAIGVASKVAKGAGSALLGAFGGPVGIAVTGLAVAIGVFASRQAEAKQRVEALTDTLDKQTGAITANTQEWARNELEQSGVLKTAERLGLNLQDVFDASLGNADALARVNAELERLAPATAAYSGAVDKQGSANAGLSRDIADVTQAIGGQNSALAQAREAQERKASITVDGADAEKEYGDEAATTTGKVVDQAKALRDAAKAVLEGVAAKQSAFDAEIGYQAALDETAAAIKENGKTATANRKELDIGTEAGRENAKALSSQAAEARRVAEENLKAGGSLKSLRADMDTARDAFIDNAVKMGLSKEAAAKMADEFGLTKGTVDNLAKSVEALPASKQIKIEAETKAAQAELKRIRTQLALIKSKSVVVTTIGRFVNEGRLPNGGRSTGGGQTFAGGGHVRGAGTATSDSIPAYLSNGEYVVRAAAVAKYGTRMFDQLNAMRFANGGSVRYGSNAPASVYGPTSNMVTNDSSLRAEVVNILTQDARSFQREMRAQTYRAKGRPGRDG